MRTESYNERYSRNTYKKEFSFLFFSEIKASSYRF
jgi:hypothetical protein